MQRWEHFNEFSNNEESVEEQALGMIIAAAIEDYEKELNQDIETYYPRFVGMKKWLKEEI